MPGWPGVSTGDSSRKAGHPSSHRAPNSVISRVRSAGKRHQESEKHLGLDAGRSSQTKGSLKVNDPQNRLPPWNHTRPPALRAIKDAEDESDAMMMLSWNNPQSGRLLRRRQTRAGPVKSAKLRVVRFGFCCLAELLEGVISGVSEYVMTYWRRRFEMASMMELQAGKVARDAATFAELFKRGAAQFS